LNKLLGSQEIKLLILSTLNLVDIFFVLNFFFNGNVLHRQLNSSDSTVSREKLYQLVLPHVGWDVPNDDSPVIIFLIDEVIIRLELDLLVLNPVVAELLSDNLDLSRSADFHICVSIAIFAKSLN
jgi:hypothetical protein